MLAVLSFGYGILQDAMTAFACCAWRQPVSALVLLAVAVGKILTTGLTIGSGGSGGVFGPSMVIGGCGGGALGIVLHRLWPALVPHPASFVIVGMAGFFAAAAKTPFSTLVIVSEMTGNYNLLLPTLWVVRHRPSCCPTSNRSTARRSRAGRGRRPTRGITSARCWPGSRSASS